MSLMGEARHGQPGHMALRKYQYHNGPLNESSFKGDLGVISGRLLADMMMRTAWVFEKIGVLFNFCGCPQNMGPTIEGFILGVLISGNSHLMIRLF